MSSSSVGQVAVKGLRQAFTFATKDVTHYFPGHMARGIRDMQRKLKTVDCIVEVHDARIPFSGRNPYFQETLMIRPHMLILNKMDLAPVKHRDRVKAKLKEEQDITNVLYTNCKEDLNRTVKHKIIPTVMEMIGDAPRYNREHEEHYNMMIIGVPNVGKSSLINALRRTNLKKGKAASVGGVAGVTRSVMEKIRVSNDPLMYVYDTPGVLTPRVPDIETGMKLALCANLKDSLVGEDHIIDFMLYWMNQQQYFNYVDHYNLLEPTDVVHEFLAHVAKRKNKIVRLKSASGSMVYRPDFLAAAKIVLKDFRSGHLGKFTLDQDLLTSDKLADIG